MHQNVMSFTLGVMVTLLVVCATMLWDGVASAILEPTQLPSNGLHPDAVYAGSLTFAGLALFGSTMLIRAFGINRYNTLIQNVGSFIVIGAILFLAILYVLFAFGHTSFPAPTVVPVTVVLIVILMVGAGMVYTKSKNEASTSSR